MDNDISTRVTIPRNDNMDVDPMVEMRLNLTCVATHNALFNMADPLVTLKVTAQGMTYCDKEQVSLCRETQWLCRDFIEGMYAGGR